MATSPPQPGTTAAGRTPVATQHVVGVLDPLVASQSSLAVQLRRVAGSIVGRVAELEAIRHELQDATSRLNALTIEGEPGVGKTRVLVAAAEMATRAGFTTVGVTADEELRGPFLLARSLFGAPALREAVAGTPAEPSVRRAVDAISGGDDPGLNSLAPDAKLLRVLDLAGMALAAVAALRPLALLIDDVQWADDDTLRLLRYLVRSSSDRPIFLLLAIRPAEFESLTEAVHLVADMERMGIVRRVRLARFTPVETGALLANVLGGPVDAVSVAALHAQAEGVPFIVEEVARAHREAGTLQQFAGEWRLGRNAARLVPQAVRTLVQRRAARLPDETRVALADAAVLGRSFSLRDLAAVRARIGGPEADGDLTERLQPAVEAGLLLAHGETEAADFTFTHEQIRQLAAAELTQARRRQLHAALVDMFLEAGDPAPASLPLLAQHALAAGDTERAARFSIAAASAALRANAPDEALRLIEQALPAVSTPDDRRALLAARDDAYATLRRANDRLTGLAELAALAEALGDPELELDVMLRRAAALRMARDEEAAAELARRIRRRAAEIGDRVAELRANLELGQALLRSPLGESFGAPATEVDLDGAEEAFRAALPLAEELGDERSLAAALRELSTISVAGARVWFTGEVMAGRAHEMVQRVVAGESTEAVLATLPIAPLIGESLSYLEKALALYERLDDRTGVMSTVIAMAYVHYAPLIHLTSSARHLEEIRRVTARFETMITESERTRLELQMLYGAHVYARAKVVPDLMLSRAEDTYRAARLAGDQPMQFLAAGGAALALLQLGDVAVAGVWLERAANVAGSYPTPMRARRLEIWRGMTCAAAGDAASMRRHFERAIDMAARQGRPAEQCEVLAQLALEAARLGAANEDGELLARAEASARQVKELLKVLPGHPPWGAQADAALAEVALAGGDLERAVGAARAAMHELEQELTEDVHLEIVLPAARAIFAGAPPEIQAMVRGWLQLLLSRIAQGTVEEAMRVRWLRGPVGRELVRLVGDIELGTPAEEMPGAGQPVDRFRDLDEVDRRLLNLLTHGSTNREMADDLGLTEEAVSQRLARLLARVGASTRAEATSLAFRGLLR